MKHIVRALLVILAVSTSAIGVAFANTEPAPEMVEAIQTELEAMGFEEMPDFGDFEIIAELEVYDALITYRTLDSSKMTLEFDLVNRGETQPAVQYLIELYKVEGDRYLLADQQELEPAFSVAGGETMHKQVTYYPPTHLEGEYEVRVLVGNSSGLTYGENSFGTVPLTAQDASVAIDTASCALTVEGEEDTYSLFQGVTSMWRGCTR